MSLPGFSVRNTVLVNMLMVLTLVAGTAFAFTLVREMFPESRPNRLMVTAIHPGVSPQEIEKAITIKVEEAVRDIEDVEKVESNVSEGVSNTVITLYNEVKDVDAAMQLVKNDVDALQDLPDDLEKITVNKLEPRLPVISVALFGHGSEATLKQSARKLRDDLLLLPGVSDVQISGIRDDEISVEIRPERLLKYDVTFDEVARAIAETNLDISGGNLKGDRTSVSVRTLGEEIQGRELEDLVVRSLPDGRNVLLRDVAIIRDNFVDVDLESRFNGLPAADCIVFKTASQDAIQIAGLVKAYVAGKQQAEFDPYGWDAALERPWYVKPFLIVVAGLKKGVAKISGRPDPMFYYEQSRKSPPRHNYEMSLHSDLSRFVEGRLDLMLRNGFQGLLLVLISLNLFLNWRVALWASIGLPVSFLGTFVVMWLLGASINLLSMFGLIIVLGIIVDDAIVIGENIYRHIEEGMPPMQAAVKGAEEVMWPVTIAVSTTIAAFAPLFFIKGQIGDFMGQLPIVVLSALSVSLLEALIILPAHLCHLPAHADLERRRAQRHPHSGLLVRAFDRWNQLQQRVMHRLLPDLYERFLRMALKWRYVTLSIAAGLLMLSTGLIAGGVVEAVFIQKMDSETLVCNLEMPVGTTAENVRQQLDNVSRYVTGVDPDTGSRRFPEVVNVQAHVARQYDIAGAGATGMTDQSHLGQLILELRAGDEREELDQRSSEELLSLFREKTRSLPGVNSAVWEALNGGPGGKDIDIKIISPDFEEARMVAAQLKAILGSLDGVFDLDDDVDSGKREVQLRLREAARPTGITVGALGSHVRSATYGREARRITRNREDVKIMVRYPEDFRSDVYHLESMWIPTGATAESRGWVPLGEVAELSEADSFTTIHRSQQQRSVSLFGEVDDEVTSTREVLAKVRTRFQASIAPLHPDVRIEFEGKSEEMAKAFGGLRVAMPVALITIFMMLAGLFRSYFQPLVVMSAIPFAFMGAVIGHWVCDVPFTILSAIGLVALTGIVVNDSLVLVDFINSRVRQGMPWGEASIQGAKLRLRAILLTTLTTAAGLTPLMFETSFQAKFLIPMAVTLTFGLIFATALTLVIVPAINMVYFDAKCLVVRLRNNLGLAGEHEIPEPV